MAILNVRQLGISFGGLRAVDNFEISVDDKELVGLIGPNGAGKTTVFNMLTGVYLPTDGSIEFDNKDIRGRKPHQIVMLGGSRTFQNIRLFKDMTVLENIKVAYHNQMSYGLFGSIFKSRRYRSDESKANEAAEKLMKVFGLEIFKDELAKNLPYGKQRKLEIARALATDPKILLLDEPAAGMNPQETEELMDTIKLLINKFNIAILLIEHDMKLVMGICERIVVLDYGKIIATGTPNEIRNNPEVIKAYLGD